MKEVWLVIDIPREAEISAYEPAAGQPRRPGGVAPGGMPLHRVRMFWRWRLGNLEVVRPTPALGRGRLLTPAALLLRPDEAGRRRGEPLVEG